MNWLFKYANPHNFMRLSNWLLPVCSVAAVLCLAVGLYFSFSAPPDYQQGATVLLLFIHVPADLMAMGAYVIIAVCSLMSVIWRHPLSDTAARAAAPLGAVFTFLGLVTGALWGKPMWGTYWVWDARLTSFLLLLFLYLGYMALWNAIEDETRAARACAILALISVVNIPIIKFSVDWWSTLHQGETIMAGKLAPVYLAPFFLMMAGYAFLFGALWMLRIRTFIVERRARTLMVSA
jgi:heme exporter protein C